MKLILTQPVEKLGKPGDVVTVADGYGRNFLVPRQLAVLANKGSLKQALRIAEDHSRKEAKVRMDAESIAARLREAVVKLGARAGADTTKLYGSVTTNDIAVGIKSQLGIEVDRRRIELDEPIRNIGDYAVAIRLHSDVIAQLHVKVEPLA